MIKLTEQEKGLLLDKFFPLGKIPFYDYTTKTLSFSDTTTRRFIFDGCAVQKSPRPKTLTDPDKLNAGHLGFGLFESLSVLIQEDYELYLKLFNFFTEVDKIASSMISLHSHAVVIFSHQSFGDRLFPHIHQDSGNDLKTLSLFFNLTDSDPVAPVLTLFDTLEVESKFFKKGYTDHKLLLLHERKSKNPDIVNISNNMCILFDADKIPHSLSYTDDIWVTIVYDHVESVCDFIDKGRYYVGTIRK
jgi:hypothetical protein